jgi:hypothetical protein
MKYLVCLWFFLLGSAFVHAQNTQPLTDASFKLHLDALEKALPDLEKIFNGIDPARQPGLDYQTGKVLEYDKDTGVMNVTMMRKSLHSLRQRRTLYEEVALQLSLAQIHETLNDLMDFSNAYKALDRFAVASNEMTVAISEAKIGDDVLERVRRLELSSMSR